MKKGDDYELLTAEAVIKHFGEPFLITSSTGTCSVEGIFREPYLGVGVSDVPIGSSDPTLQIKDGSCPSLKRGATFVRRGKTYKVNSIEDDGSMVTLQLHEV